jgi:hypothetical protein
MPVTSCHDVLIHKRFIQYHCKFQDKIGCNIFFFKLPKYVDTSVVVRRELTCTIIKA